MIKINTKFEQEVPFQVQNYQLQPTLEKGRMRFIYSQHKRTDRNDNEKEKTLNIHHTYIDIHTYKHTELLW